MALRTDKERLSRLGPCVRLRCGREARPNSPILRGLSPLPGMLHTDGGGEKAGEAGEAAVAAMEAASTAVAAVAAATAATAARAAAAARAEGVRRAAAHTRSSVRASRPHPGASWLGLGLGLG